MKTLNLHIFKVALLHSLCPLCLEKSFVLCPVSHQEGRKDLQKIFHVKYPVPCHTDWRVFFI